MGPTDYQYGKMGKRQACQTDEYYQELVPALRTLRLAVKHSIGSLSLHIRSAEGEIARFCESYDLYWGLIPALD